MAYSSFKVHEIVEHAVSHNWSVPEFQRGFVWKATQVRDLAESLWLNYPVGSILIWDSGAQRHDIEPRNVADTRSPALWLVDGQQRTTALCILSGRKPYWWSDGQDWNAILDRYDVRFDIHTKEPPFFRIADAAIRRVRTNRYIRVRDLLRFNLDNDQDQKSLIELAKNIKADGLCDGKDAIEVKTRLERVCRIRGRELVGITVDHDLEEVVEIFARLNSKGTRVKEADIYLGVVAARAPGWVRQHFMPFLNDLEDYGFAISPNLLFMSLTAVGAKRVRFRQVPDDFWNAAHIQPAWEKTKKAWFAIVRFLEPLGILTNDLLPSDAVFVTLAAYFDKFQVFDRKRVTFWMMQALRYGRYSVSGATSIDEDLRDIETKQYANDALDAMLGRIRAIEPISKEEFLRDYSDSRFGRLLLYSLVFKNQALDWTSQGDRIAFQGADLVRGFQPQFHHIFPRNFLAGKAKPELVESLANIAIIGAGVNIRISNSDPLHYFQKYDIGLEKRGQQFIDGDVASLTIDRFPDWIDQRALLLANAANEFLRY